MDSILQLKITLKGSKPPIWRRVLVDKSITFDKLHYIIQIVMGWNTCHLYEFDINDYTVLIPDEFDDEFTKDSSTTTLESMISEAKHKFIYTYDFGDNWEHIILVEKILPPDSKITYPICITGKLNCPPEDCGGIYGFYELLKITKDKNHPDHEEMIEYIDEDYDPEYFDVDEANELLLNIDDYQADFEDLF